MTYPGNSSLAADVQQRILTTFRQSVQSASQGNRDEALLGCDFVLRLDPQFGPARKLQQMIGAGEAPEAILALLDGGAVEAGGGDPESAGLRAVFEEMLAARRFAEILNAAERDKRKVGADPALRRLVEQAQSRFEADPYVAKFAESAELAIRSGETDEAKALIEKARSLDPTHPRVAELDEMVGHYDDPSRRMGGRRHGVSFDEVDEGEAAEEAAEPVEGLDLGFDLPDAAEAGFEAAGASDEADLERPPEETSGRIVELLGEGQSAFDRGEYQSAIDAWSRIFLIDIDHEEAARKIEQARQLKAEREREIEEIFHDGVARFDSGDLAGAREAFERVLGIQPGYALAREYLEKLEEREAGGELPGAGLPELAPIDDGPAPGAPGASAPAAGPSQIEVAPAASPRRGARRPVGDGYAATARRGTGGMPSMRFLVIGGGFLLLLAAGAWYLFSRWDSLFPNAEPPIAAAVQPDAIARARDLHDQGQTAMAVAQLRRVTPVDPSYAEAQSLISQWEKLLAEDEAILDDGTAARRRALLEEAQRALTSNENFLARKLFARASELAPLDGDWVVMAATAEENLVPLVSEIEMFRDGEFELLLNQLWRRREAEPGNRDIARLIADSYYNLGVLDLQRGDPVAARDKFREARAIDAADPALLRLERFASTYERRKQDLLYRIFVKYLQGR
ncbi:MAG TPA: hypothetical protein VLA66_09465 [Thermoanaerobaculia bacterium]|nr:hypothetical protein [Thermoanaerobaculia bacterium]